MDRVKVTSRNQITLPKAVREKLNVKPGDYLLVDLRDKRIVLTPEAGNHAQRLRGFHREIWEGVDPLEYIEQQRSSWGK